MEFFDLIQKRYSVRNYRPDPVEDEILEQALTAASLAPTAANRQPFQLVVLHTRGRENELKRIYPKDWFVQAPVIVCACSLKAQGWVRADGKSFNDVDIAIVMDHLILAATNLGLGTCWIADFDVQAAREVLCLPPDVEPVVLTPLGYPSGEPRTKERRPVADLVRYERW